MWEIVPLLLIPPPKIDTDWISMPLREVLVIAPAFVMPPLNDVTLRSLMA